MGIGRHRQLLDVAAGQLDQAVGVVGEPQVLSVTPGALGRQDVAQQRGQRLLGARRRRGRLGRGSHAHTRTLNGGRGQRSRLPYPATDLRLRPSAGHRCT